MRRLIAVLACLLLPPGVLADSTVRTAGDDRFAAGGGLVLREAVAGDLIAAGGEVDVLSTVDGDGVLAGGRVRVDGAVGDDLYAAAGRLAVEGAVAGSARLAGGSVAIGPRGRVAGGTSIAGGRVTVLGALDGYLHVAAGRVLLDGPVRGRVQAAARELELGPNARLEGGLRYVEGGRLVRHPDAQVAGRIERFALPGDGESVEGPDLDEAALAFLAVWTAGLMVLAAALVAVFPGACARLAENARRSLGWSLLAGLLVLVLTPVAILAAGITVIGLPLALLLGLAYLALALTGFAAAGVALGDSVLGRWGAARAARTGWRALAAAAGVLLLGLLALVPVAGAIVAFLALVAGMGAIVLLRRT